MHIPSLKDSVDAEEWQLRCDLAACYRLVALNGMTDLDALYGGSELVFTHISAKLPVSVPGEGGHHFLINPYGLMFDEITASSLVKVDERCNKAIDSPFQVNPAGFVIHSAVHEARADVARHPGEVASLERADVDNHIDLGRAISQRGLRLVYFRFRRCSPERESDHRADFDIRTAQEVRA